MTESSIQTAVYSLAKVLRNKDPKYSWFGAVMEEELTNDSETSHMIVVLVNKAPPENAIPDEWMGYFVKALNKPYQEFIKERDGRAYIRQQKAKINKICND